VVDVLGASCAAEVEEPELGGGHGLNIYIPPRGTVIRLRWRPQGRGPTARRRTGATARSSERRRVADVRVRPPHLPAHQAADRAHQLVDLSNHRPGWRAAPGYSGTPGEGLGGSEEPALLAPALEWDGRPVFPPSAELRLPRFSKLVLLLARSPADERPGGDHHTDATGRARRLSRYTHGRPSRRSAWTAPTRGWVKLYNAAPREREVPDRAPD
jgi:hypothetical protein